MTIDQDKKSFWQKYKVRVWWVTVLLVWLASTGWLGFSVGTLIGYAFPVYSLNAKIYGATVGLCIPIWLTFYWWHR